VQSGEAWRLHAVRLPAQPRQAGLYVQALLLVRGAAVKGRSRGRHLLSRSLHAWGGVSAARLPQGKWQAAVT